MSLKAAGAPTVEVMYSAADSATLEAKPVTLAAAAPRRKYTLSL